MRFRRAALAGATSVCLVALVGVGNAAAAPGDPSGGPGRSAEGSGLLSGLTDTVDGLLGGGQDASTRTTPAATPTPDVGSSDNQPALPNLPIGVPGVAGSDGDAPAEQGSTGGDSSTDDHGASVDGSDPAGNGGLSVADIPLPKPGENLPDNLCLPSQLTSALPASIPTCLDLTVCKAGLIRDLEQLPRVKLTALGQYVQRVLHDIPECLLSLLPPLPSATISPSPTPSQSTPESPPQTQEPTLAPAAPASPVAQRPNFTG